jgi:hypothetical protein
MNDHHQTKSAVTVAEMSRMVNTPLASTIAQSTGRYGFFLRRRADCFSAQ